ncbi:MAG TPA: lyase family protein [Methylomirabilota bacterium]|nr:lyase family protein [Methylomirabilota bacterium]
MRRRRRPQAAARLERDDLGSVAVPRAALWGAFTERARQTFHLTGRPPHPALVRAYARIKQAAARVNGRLGLLPRRWAAAIAGAADRVARGLVPDAAAVDVLQAGAGTPAHMNVNEVVATLANEQLGGRRGRWAPLHPNSHVNLGQSSNDVTPTAIRLMALELLDPLDAELRALVRALRRHAARTRAVVKPGRTHLQDAVPITWGQVFGGWAQAIEDGRRALDGARGELRVVALGGTAVGTGLTAHPRFRLLVVRELSRLVGRRLRPAPSPVASAWSLRPLGATSAALRGIALDLGKVCLDLRLLASGPDTGLAELALPEVEPGSSIMPGKVNPSVPEAVQMACFQVVAHDHAVALAAGAGELELNVMTPLVADNLAGALELLARAVRLLRTRCVKGLAVDRRRARALVAGSLIEATALSPYLGYDVTAELVKEARTTGRPLRQVVLDRGLLDARALARVLSPAALTGPRATDIALRRRLQRGAAYRALRTALAEE